MGIQRSPDHRRIDTELVLLGPDRQPLAHRPVTVSQRSHAMIFGCTGFELLPYANDEVEGEALEIARRVEQRWLELFNAANLPFDWDWLEPTRGKPDTQRLSIGAQWVADRGVAVKGHPLCWHSETAPWLLDLSAEEIRQVKLDRIRREVEGFADLIAIWDAVNEAMIMPVFDRYPNSITTLAQRLGRVELLRQTFEVAREANLAATLLINDFDLSEPYARLIEEALEAGVPSGFVHVDGMPKPSFKALRSLIKGDWWLSSAQLVADAAGVIAFEETAGEYEIRVDDRVSAVDVAGGQANRTLVLGAESGLS